MEKGDNHKLIVRLEGLSVAEANRYVTELEDQIRQVAHGHVRTDRQKERQDTQDFGATLVVILGTPAALAVAKGIHDFIAKRGSRVVIETEFGKIVASGDAASNIDIAATAAALQNPLIWSKQSK